MLRYLTVAFLLTGLFLCATAPAHADTVFNVALSNITFAPINNVEVVNASFNWDVTTSTVSDIYVSTSPLVFQADAGTVTDGQADFQGVTYLKVVDIGLDSFGDVLQVYNDVSVQQGVPAVPGTYDASLRIGQVFFSCGSDCRQFIGSGSGQQMATAGTITVTAVPEPASISLLLVGLCSAFPILRKVTSRHRS